MSTAMARILTIADPEGRYHIAEALSTSDTPEAHERDVEFVRQLALVLRKDCVWQVVEADDLHAAPGLEPHAALCVHCGLVIRYERGAHAGGGSSGWVHSRNGEPRCAGGKTGATPPEGDAHAHEQVAS